ncbi:N-methyltryptophan oxidase [Mycobacterium basiliense]|uniref:N-methyltryptophan oxidase n=1 Tax=Mycobacterium basiliense TaxID=2094119 RepID=A0A447GCQ6_9MYCO|nr:FAD-dependent oxidoreductase [Mycobacterium basiliense]VDM88224.1 N-methyltryptophan oxidase [Mycobacterium basiliense]
MRALDLSYRFDAIVVGSGIAGLTAGIYLQQQGISTLILERRTVPGGLCGTFFIDGYEFVTGCNDFGRGLEQSLVALGVKAEFLAPKARFHLGSHAINLPPTVSTSLKLVRRSPGILSAIRAARRTPQQTVGQLIDAHLQDPLLAAAACIPIYALMRSPDDVTVGEIQQNFSKELDYGYEKSRTPVGGPRRMIDAMVRRFEMLGGQLRFGCASLAVEPDGTDKRVHTSAGTFWARAVLSSQGRWNHFPSGTKPGLEAALFLLAVRKSFPYPRRYHTIAWFHAGIAEELRRLDAGLRAHPPSFHIFRSDLPEQPDHYTINAVIPLPRGERNPSTDRRQELCAYILSTIEQSMPGFRESVIYQRFLSPAEYEDLLGLSSAPSPYVPPAGFGKLSSYDPDTDIYFLGTSVGPPGEHAGAAAKSGKNAAHMASRRLTN